MQTLAIIFWIFIAVVFYTYIGYGILLYILVKIKESVCKPKDRILPDELPEVTLLIAAFNEQDIVAQKMENTMQLDYPTELLQIAWVTDGSTDSTNELLSRYDRVRVLFEAPRRGKSAAVNRAMNYIHTPIIIFTDANTMICPEAIKEIVTEFTDPKVGCVAGEKRVAQLSMQDATAGEGVYWRYESALKTLDYRLYSAVGAAGELFAIRTNLYIKLPDDTLLDDFIMSMKIAQNGYKIAYCKEAYAIEEASANIEQEAKRKVRISAGGIQSIIRLHALLNVFRYGVLSFQYISHRVLRWSVTPVMLFALLPLNLALCIGLGFESLYGAILAMQVIFYALGLGGHILNKRKIKNKILFVPYYFLFMNACVIRGINYLRTHKGSGVWEKAQRKNG